MTHHKPQAVKTQGAVCHVDDSAEVVEQMLKHRVSVWYVRRGYGRDVRGRRTMGRYHECSSVLEMAEQILGISNVVEVA